MASECRARLETPSLILLRFGALPRPNPWYDLFSRNPLMLANLASPTITYNVQEVLIFRDCTTMTVGVQTVKRAADRPMWSEKIYRIEWEHDPSSAYRWSWFDHHEDLIAIV